jgi:hypothetical protein
MAAHAPDRLRRGRAGARHRGGENRLKSGNFVADLKSANSVVYIVNYVIYIVNHVDSPVAARQHK